MVYYLNIACKLLFQKSKNHANVIFLVYLLYNQNNSFIFVDMKITLLMIGKTSFPFVKEGLEMYEKRLVHYISYKRIEIADLKKTSALSKGQIKDKEGDLILKHISSQDDLILLDEKGKSYSSIEWASYLEHKIVNSGKNITFVIGGAYGFSEKIYKRANSKLSFSRMTFSHQIIRLFFTEQIYRAFTIIKGEPYHNE